MTVAGAEVLFEVAPLSFAAATIVQEGGVSDDADGFSASTPIRGVTSTDIVVSSENAAGRGIAVRDTVAVLEREQWSIPSVHSGETGRRHAHGGVAQPKAIR